MDSSTNSSTLLRSDQPTQRNSIVSYVNRKNIPLTIQNNNNEYSKREGTQSARNHVNVVHLSRGKSQSAQSNKSNESQNKRNHIIHRSISIIPINQNGLHSAQVHRKTRQTVDTQNHITVERVKKTRFFSAQNDLLNNSSDRKIIQSPENDVNNDNVTKNNSQSEYDNNNVGIENIHTKQSQSVNNMDVPIKSESAISRSSYDQNRTSSSIKRLSTDNIRDLVHPKKRKIRNIFHRRCCILCLIITLALLLAAILAPLLALLLKHSTTVSTTVTTSSTTSQTSTTSNTATSSSSTTVTTTTSESTSTSSTTTTGSAITCTPTGHGTLLSLTGANPPGSVWTYYQFNYTAMSSTMSIIFGFRNENNRRYYLDNVSIVDNNSPSIELLQNSNFENSTIVATGWIQWCTNTCSGNPGIIISGSSCYSGNCYDDNCYASSGIDFIEQSIGTTINQTYTVSFMLKLGGSGTTTANAFYADIL